MQKIFLSTIFILVVLVGCNQKNTSNTEKKDSVVTNIPSMSIDSTLYKTICAFVEAYENKNNQEVNKLIHPELGLAVIYRPGVADVFTKIDTFSFDHPMPNYWAYEPVKNEFSLAFDSLPEYDCGLEKWSKKGLFCDTISSPNQLSLIIDFEREFISEKYSVEFLKQIKSEEAESYRVILTSENPLIFHVKKHQGSWYVSVLDRAYAGCDA